MISIFLFMIMSYQEIIVKLNSFKKKKCLYFLVQNCNLTLTVSVIFI